MLELVVQPFLILFGNKICLNLILDELVTLALWNNKL